MKRAIFAGLSGVIALFTLMAVVSFSLPVTFYKSQIEQGVSAATRRAFTISGPLYFSAFPSFSITAENVALANPPGYSSSSLATANAVSFDIRLWPLLFGQLEITQVIVDHPVINLQINTDGRANWRFERKQKAPKRRVPWLAVRVERLSGVKIERGRISYANLRSRSRQVFEDLNANLNIIGVNKPAHAEGSFSFSGHRVGFNAQVTTPGLLLDEHVANIDISSASDLLRASFRGTVTPYGFVNGTTHVEAPSLRAVAVWLGARPPQTGGFGPILLNSHVAGDDTHFRLNVMTTALDGMTLRGATRVDLDGTVPHIAGTLLVDHLDLNPYVERPQRAAKQLSRQDNDNWSDEPFTLDALKKVDADLTLDTGSLALRNLHLGKAHIVLALHGARLRADLKPFELYRGTGKAVLDIDARGTPVFNNTLEFENIALEPFLSSTIGVKQIEGIGNIRLELASNGDTPDTIMHRISGKGTISFRDGRVRGVNLVTVARTIQSLFGSSIQSDEFTEYEKLCGSFVVVNGLLDSKDFQLDGPIVRMAGTGTVDIGNHAIDVRVVPHANTVIANQKLSIGLPFRIRGPWRHVHYTADLAGLMSGVLDNLKTGQASLKGLFGSQSPKALKTPKKKHKSLDDALKNMFGIH